MGRSIFIIFKAPCSNGDCAARGLVYDRAMSNKITNGADAFIAFCTPSAQSRESAGAPSKLMLRAQSGSVDHEGFKLQTYKWAAKDESMPVRRAYLVHGWESRASHMSGFVGALLRAGFEVIAYDGPSQGSSGGETTNLVDSARALMNVINTYGPADAIIAHSFGGLIANFARSENPLLDKSLIVSKLVLLASPFRLMGISEKILCDIGADETMRAEFYAALQAAAGLPAEYFDVETLALQSGTDCLIVHDEGDEFVPLVAAQTLARITGGELKLTQGHGHQGVLAAREVLRAAVDFVKA